uniref:Aminotransferase n=1 Tax=Steinernema glaseri TaxID=37863 RepID=A0A1I7ZGR2_9BILA
MSRRFGEEVPNFADVSQGTGAGTVADGDLLKWIREDEIGRKSTIKTPFGWAPVTYCDYTASARALDSIEGYLKDEVLPIYGNTHSSATTTAEQSTLFLHEARDVIRNSVNASEHDAVLFCGSGSTAASNVLANAFVDSPQEVAIVCGIHEHHSNLLPWRRITNNVTVVGETDAGDIDLVELEETLRTLRKTENLRIVGCFTAASNVTGVLADVPAVTAVLKKFDALAVWDYATAAPYVEINMNGTHALDAVFFSGHKFIGGVQSPGVLVVKKSILNAARPNRVGGGTVFFVSPEQEVFLKEAEYREEAGTPDLVGAVRLALAFKLKNSVGHEQIARRESEIADYLIGRLAKNKNIVLLGSRRTSRRLPVISFLIRDAPSGLFYHHNLVGILLNDLFGIQSRSGCACAGPYAQHLLGIDAELTKRYLAVLLEDPRLDRVHLRRQGEYSAYEFFRPGFTRVSVPYFVDDRQLVFVADAIEFIAEHISQFMPQYQLNVESGEYHHYKQRVFHNRKWIGHLQFTAKGLVDESRNEQNDTVFSYDQLLSKAAALAEQPLDPKVSVPDGTTLFDETNIELKWFVMASEVMQKDRKPQPCPFEPKKYSEVAEEGEGLEAIVERIEASVKVEDEEELPEEEASGDQKVVEECPLNGEECPLISEACDVNGTGDCPLEPNDENETEPPLDDWNRRVVVEARELSKEEEKALKWCQPTMDMFRKVREAIQAMDMIQEGDRILVCLSGGKDSLSLLHLMKFYQQRCRKYRKVNFHLGAITVDPGSAAYNPRPLIEYCRSLNIDYFYEEQDIIGQARRAKECRSICGFCSRMKRGRLAAAAQLHGYNVLALGQHLDDLAESFLITAFQNGILSTMKAQYTTKDKKLRVIRPLVYVREKELRDFAEQNNLPVIPENCPACFSSPTERYRMKQLLASQELLFPKLFNSLKSALKPLLEVCSPFSSEMRSMAVQNIVQHQSGKPEENGVAEE